MRLFGVNSSASTSAADPLSLVGEYDVFLSFCGQDTRYAFTDFLYTSLYGAGIRTFKDNEGLHVGEEICPELIKAITNSKISIPIFSKNYAFSKWCLFELVHMVQCQKNEAQMIFPIFYDVDPCDVRHQSGSYEEAFRQHRKKRYNEKTIREWKEALSKVGQLKGLKLKKETGGHEGELVKIITNKVLEFLKQNNKHEDKDLVSEYDFPRLVGEKFLRLPNLRYLALDHPQFDGDFEHCLPNLKWLKWITWWERFMPTKFHLRNLVILDLSHSHITKDWDVWSQIKMSKKLKVLDLDGCLLLSRVPFLSTYSNLERLVVSRCWDLCSLDGIEEFESLRYLDATGCFSLKTMPNLSRLRKLQELKVSYCELIIDIPGLDKLECLELLFIQKCRSLERLPDLSNLKRLKVLDAYDVMLTEIRGLGELKSLEVFTMSDCEGIERLSDFSNLKRLRKLGTRKCFNLIEIHGLEGLESLEHMVLDGCRSLERLPDLSNLRSLKRLSVSSCRALVKIQGLHRLESLEHLDMSGTSIERVPALPIFGMLKEINLEEYENDKLPSTGEILRRTDISNLTKLRIIRAACCPKLREIRGLEELKSLEFLDIGSCSSIENLPDFSNLKKLEDINATDCEKLTEIQGLEKLESLRVLYIRGCMSLKNLPYLQDSRIHEDYNDDACFAIVPQHLILRGRFGNTLGTEIGPKDDVYVDGFSDASMRLGESAEGVGFIIQDHWGFILFASSVFFKGSALSKENDD
ncbi:hypothetical protein LguiB_010430 [Lonicera macranthoides]